MPQPVNWLGTSDVGIWPLSSFYFMNRFLHLYQIAGEHFTECTIVHVVIRVHEQDDSIPSTSPILKQRAQIVAEHPENGRV